ncbi:MAG: ATP-binding cassette domain-containing protein [Synergistaceae bacterium]|jgi:ABC-type glutathione transport system ATPase component|nr:ATP-binding cassette domain-containing protein [Synergistaceae bacterium]
MNDKVIHEEIHEKIYEEILRIENVKVHFSKRSNLFSRGGKGVVKAVDGVTLSMNAREIYGIVGESGSGKTTLGRAVIGLIPISSGEITVFDAKICAGAHRRSPLYRTRVQMIFQDPDSSLNPNMTVARLLAEPILVNRLLPQKLLPERLKELLDMVDLPRTFLSRYPHQMSGGQKQRVAVARAMATDPRLIIADEPTSALDVSVQAQILNLLMDLKEKKGVSILFISHNMAVVRHISDRVSVMQAGRIVETASAEKLFAYPREDYTKKLLRAIPKIRRFPCPAMAPA